MIYTLPKDFIPDFSHPSTRRVAFRALSYVKCYVRIEKVREIAITTLTRYFGQTQTNTSKWLFNTLLLRANSYYNADNKIAMKYFRKPGGVEYLTRLLTESGEESEDSIAEITFEEAKELYCKQYQKELEALEDGTLEYIEKSDRLYSPLQNGRKEIKKAVLSDMAFVHQYDTVCSAPTLLYQYSQQLGLGVQLSFIEQYLGDRTLIRNNVSKDLGISKDLVKMIINSMFAGAKLGCSFHFAIFKKIDFDEDLMKSIQGHPYIAGLRLDLKVMWKNIIDKSIPREYKEDKNGILRMVQISSRQKWMVYFQQERKVLDSICQYSFINNLPSMFLEHDGFSTKVKINIDSLVNHIEIKTGFKVKLEYEYIGKDKQVVSYSLYESFVSSLYSKNKFNKVVPVNTLSRKQASFSPLRVENILLPPLIITFLENNRNVVIFGGVKYHYVYISSTDSLRSVVLGNTTINLTDIRDELSQYTSNSLQEQFISAVPGSKIQKQNQLEYI